MSIRLNKHIADCTGISRRNADGLIDAGSVWVNGKRGVLGQTVDPRKDKVTMDGKPLVAQVKLYVAFYKPTGVLTTRHDPDGRKTIYDLIPEKYHHLDPVGRLDRESSGLILLSNDGNFVQKLSHPRYQHGKVYRVKVDKPLTVDILKQLEKGILLQPENALAQAKVQDVPDPKTVMLVLKTGMNRQIRRSFEALDYTVLGLKRTAIAGILLGNLTPGRLRQLKPSELSALLKTIGEVRVKRRPLRK